MKVTLLQYQKALIRCVLLILICVLLMTNIGCHADNAVKDNSSSASAPNSQIQTTSATISNQLSTTTTQTAPTTVKTSIQKSTSTTSKPTTTTKKTTKSTAYVGPKHPTSGIPWDGVTQADPKTGLSWDGKSPIIYTYTDGTTGTEPKDDATYEFVPGIKHGYTVFKDGNNRPLGSICNDCGKKVGNGDIGPHTCYQTNYPEYCFYCGAWLEANTCHSCKSNDHHCTDCGKVMGDGLNGTCLSYWAGGDHVCFNCGETIPANTCHTCTQGCRYCTKPLGNGRNGTCYRDSFSPTKCPCCGANVPTDTCHSCK